MVMGRPNKGADHVDSLDASPRERERLRALLLTIMGEISNEDAAAMLDLGLSQFASMRTRALQGAADALAPGQPGRPRKHDPRVDARVRALQAENAELRRQLNEARVREELALAQVPLRPKAPQGGGRPVKRFPR